MNKTTQNPWERIDWSPACLQNIYCFWGVFYTHSQQLDKAEHYYNKSLEIRDDDYRALYYRSQCKRDVGQPQMALEDALFALEIYPTSAPIKLEICDALYEMNQFERAKVELHTNARSIPGKGAEVFHERTTVIRENLNDSIGETLGPFIFKNYSTFHDALTAMNLAKSMDNRPLWKILRDQKKCDVISILEKQEKMLSPREIARRERCFKVFNQIYLNKSWIDVIFLKNLCDNENLLLPQCYESTPKLRKLVTSTYATLKKFLKMLHARSPLYNELQLRCPNKEVWERHRKEHLLQIQYRTRRNMITILRSVKQLRESGRVRKLARYIEEVMGDYVVLKTDIIMPWKFEFINEVYNTLALAYTDQYFVPVGIMNLPSKTRKAALLGIQGTNFGIDRNASFIFGDNSQYREAAKYQRGIRAYKAYQLRLEKRLRYTKYSIERCYLYHELAYSHLEHNHFEECCVVARKAARESNICKNIIWKFLAAMIVVKAHAILHRVERCKEALERARRIAQHLQNLAIINFLDMCLSVNEDELEMKKHSQSLESMRKRRSKFSVMSRNSLQTESEAKRDSTDSTEKPNSLRQSKSIRSIKSIRSVKNMRSSRNKSSMSLEKQIE